MRTFVAALPFCLLVIKTTGSLTDDRRALQDCSGGDDTQTCLCGTESTICTNKEPTTWDMGTPDTADDITGYESVSTSKRQDGSVDTTYCLTFEEGIDVEDICVTLNGCTEEELTTTAKNGNGDICTCSVSVGDERCNLCRTCGDGKVSFICPDFSTSTCVAVGDYSGVVPLLAGEGGNEPQIGSSGEGSTSDASGMIVSMAMFSVTTAVAFSTFQ